MDSWYHKKARAKTRYQKKKSVSGVNKEIRKLQWHLEQAKRKKRQILKFDSSKGYPGEGPFKCCCFGTTPEEIPPDPEEVLSYSSGRSYSYSGVPADERHRLYHVLDYFEFLVDGSTRISPPCYDTTGMHPHRHRRFDSTLGYPGEGPWFSARCMVVFESRDTCPRKAHYCKGEPASGSEKRFLETVKVDKQPCGQFLKCKKIHWHVVSDKKKKTVMKWVPVTDKKRRTASDDKTTGDNKCDNKNTQHVPAQKAEPVVEEEKFTPKELVIDSKTEPALSAPPPSPTQISTLKGEKKGIDHKYDDLVSDQASPIDTPPSPTPKKKQQEDGDVKKEKHTAKFSRERIEYANVWVDPPGARNSFGFSLHKWLKRSMVMSLMDKLNPTNPAVLPLVMCDRDDLIEADSCLYDGIAVGTKIGADVKINPFEQFGFTHRIVVPYYPDLLDQLRATPQMRLMTVTMETSLLGTSSPKLMPGTLAAMDQQAAYLFNTSADEVCRGTMFCYYQQEVRANLMMHLVSNQCHS